MTMSDNESDLGSMLGKVLGDVQEEGLAGAGKKLLGGLFGNAFSAFTGGGDTEQGVDEEDDEASPTADRRNTHDDDAEATDDDDDKGVNTAGGNYQDTQVAGKLDHDVDDDIDGDEDDT